MNIFKRLFGSKLPKELQTPEMKKIISELCELADGSPAEHETRKARTREIGNFLNEQGGFGLMVKINNVVRQRAGGANARLIESWWDGIGTWHG